MYTSETLENLVERCSKPRNQIIRVSTLKLADIAVLQASQVLILEIHGT